MSSFSQNLTLSQISIYKGGQVDKFGNVLNPGMKTNLDLKITSDHTQTHVLNLGNINDTYIMYISTNEVKNPVPEDQNIPYRNFVKLLSNQGNTTHQALYVKYEGRTDDSSVPPTPPVETKVPNNRLNIFLPKTGEVKKYIAWIGVGLLLLTGMLWRLSKRFKKQNIK